MPPVMLQESTHDWIARFAGASAGSQKAQRAQAGGAVLSRTTSSVDSSTRVWAGSAPPAIATTISAAAVAMSISGWRTVVSGGPTHCATGRSSKPMTLRSSGIWSRASRAAW